MIEIVKKIAQKNQLDYKTLIAFILTETGGKGFVNGKIIIQFEPHYFKARVPFAPSGKWSINKVDVQVKEWEAFNNAFTINPNAAMESTSIGLGQIMGSHWKRLGFKSVGEMWDYSKASLENQIELVVRFIKTDLKLLGYIKTKDWHNIALLYNGASYQEMAVKWGREPYNITMQKHYDSMA
jgi:N-acetylmuramidase